MAVMNITSNNFASLVLKSQKPSVVLFWAMGSPRNAAWDRYLHALDEEGADAVTLCKVSVNYAPHIAMRFHIAVYPTIVLFRGKEVLAAFSGQPSMKALRDLIALANEPERADETHTNPVAGAGPATITGDAAEANAGKRA